VQEVASGLRRRFAAMELHHEADLRPGTSRHETPKAGHHRLGVLARDIGTAIEGEQERKRILGNAEIPAAEETLQRDLRRQRHVEHWTVHLLRNGAPDEA